MQRLFNGENLFFRLMGKLGDFMCLNVLFLLTSLPIVTAGASVSALYVVLFDMRRGKDGSCFRRYMQAFQKNFRRATVYWLVCLSVAVFLILGFWGSGYMDRRGRVIFQAAFVLLSFVWMGMLSFGLILISWTETTVRRAIQSTVLITVGSFPWLILNILITGIPILFIVAGNRYILAYGIPLFLLFGVPLLSYVKMYVYRRALKKYGLIEEE